MSDRLSAEAENLIWAAVDAGYGAGVNGGTSNAVDVQRTGEALRDYVRKLEQRAAPSVPPSGAPPKAEPDYWQIVTVGGYDFRTIYSNVAEAWDEAREMDEDRPLDGPHTVRALYLHPPTAPVSSAPAAPAEDTEA